MQPLPASNWQLYLLRINQRYAGRSVTLRQQGHDESQLEVLLWRCPLRGLFADTCAPGAEVTILAGHDHPYIEFIFRAVQEIGVHLAADQSLELLRVTSSDGIIASLVFNDEE